jgi:hypothetical protein
VVSVALNRASNRLPPTELTPVAWLARSELAYDEWLRHGSRLGVAGRGAAWWVGDWVRYGTARYGSKYAAASRVTGYDRQTLMNMVYVATRFELSRRRENLSWSHHAEVAAFEIDEQERWLERASEERFSVRDLRDALLAVRQPAARARTRRKTQASQRASALQMDAAEARRRDLKLLPPSKAAGQKVVCPHCGHSFAP